MQKSKTIMNGYTKCEKDPKNNNILMKGQHGEKDL
jgi:hypothetical protein